MLIPVFRLAAMSAHVTDAQREMVDAGAVDDIASAVDAIAIHFLDEDMIEIGDDRTTIDVCAIRYVAVMLHAVTGGLHPDFGFDVHVDRDEGFDEDHPDDRRAAHDNVEGAVVVANAIADAVAAALRHERQRLGLSIEHLA